MRILTNEPNEQLLNAIPRLFTVPNKLHKENRKQLTRQLLIKTTDLNQRLNNVANRYLYIWQLSQLIRPVGGMD